MADGLLPTSSHPCLHLVPLCGGTGALLPAAAEAAGAAGSAGRLQPGRGGIIQLHVLRGEEAGLVSTWEGFEFQSLQIPGFEQLLLMGSAEGSGSWLGHVPCFATRGAVLPCCALFPPVSQSSCHS